MPNNDFELSGTLDQTLTTEGRVYRMRKAGPRYLRVVDEDGCRHLIRVTAIQVMSDADPIRDATIVVVAGRSICVPTPLDVVIEALDGELDAADRKC